MRKLVNYSLSEFSEELASRSPAPGGGSCAALVAALGVALLEMSMRYSQFPASEVADVRKTRLKLMQLVEKDAKAYQQVVQSRKKKPAYRQQALVRAVEIPLEICESCDHAI